MMEVAASPSISRMSPGRSRSYSPVHDSRHSSPSHSPHRRPATPTLQMAPPRSLMPTAPSSANRPLCSPELDRRTPPRSSPSRPSMVSTPPPPLHHTGTTHLHSPAAHGALTPGAAASSALSHPLSPHSAALSHFTSAGHAAMLGSSAFPVPLPSSQNVAMMAAAAAAASAAGCGVPAPPGLQAPHHLGGGVPPGGAATGTSSVGPPPPLGSLSNTNKPSYTSPPPAPNNSDNNQCSQIDYRGARVAAFMVEGRQLICLPQAFELFLKHLVGGLHTVYTKLKRLDITPIVCNVEQVRILRGLGAIQPGVNRCKLIAPAEFDVLYDDCTNSNARPGRPPKRSPSVNSAVDTMHDKFKKSRMDSTDFSPYNPHSRMLGYMFPDPKKSPLFGNGYHYPPHLASMAPFMHLGVGHPMMPAAAAMAMANHPMAAALRPDASPHLIPPPQTPHDVANRLKGDDKYGSEDNNNYPVDKPLNLQVDKPDNKQSTKENTDGDSHSGRIAEPKPLSGGTSLFHSTLTGGHSGGGDGLYPHHTPHTPTQHTPSQHTNNHTPPRTNTDHHTHNHHHHHHHPHEGTPRGEHQHMSALHHPHPERRPVGGAGEREEAREEDDDMSASDIPSDDEKEHGDVYNKRDARIRATADLLHSDKGMFSPVGGGGAGGVGGLSMLTGKDGLVGPGGASGADPRIYNSTGVLANDNSNFSSVETLLLNIQGLLKVAVENARHRENQINCEKAELKMEILREKTKRDTLERQLTDERQATSQLHRKLKKEKHARKKMQDQLEGSSLAVTSSNMSPAPAPPQGRNGTGEGEDDEGRGTPNSDQQYGRGGGAESPSSDREHDHETSRSLEDSFSDRRDYKDRSLSATPPDTEPDMKPLGHHGGSGRSGLQSLMDTFLGPQSAAAFLHATPTPVLKATENTSA